MKKIFFTLLLLFALQIVAQKKLNLQPVIKKQVVSVISGNQYTYYSLNSTLTFPINGYDRIAIFSRERLQGKALGYTIFYEIDNIEKQYIVGKKRKDYKSAYLNKNIKKDVSVFSKKNIVIKNQSSISIKNNSNIDIRIIGFKGKKRTQLKPLIQNTKVRIVNGKVNKYYKINSKIPTLIETVQEGKLIVYSRKRMLPNSSDNYSFAYRINDTLKTVNIQKVQKSTQAVYASKKINGTPSTYNKIVINIGDKYQEILFTSKFPIDARFVFIKTIKKNGWEELESNSGKIVPLIVKKKKIVRDYTRIEANKPFQFSINKETEIKVLIRGEFKYDMHANNDYEIVLKDNGKIINTYKLSCHRSNVMKYKFNNVLIPGTLDKFIIKVPKGEHNYSISINNQGKTALIRILKRMPGEIHYFANKI